VEKSTTQMHADSKKQSSFLALLFAAGDLGRSWRLNTAMNAVLTPSAG
jgi:hypothetical protein